MTTPPRRSTPGQRPSPFLERHSYRRRRLMDAARLVPILGVFLWSIPVLWSAAPTQATSQAILYLFGVWAVLIVLAALVSTRLRGSGAHPDEGSDAP